MSKIFNFDNVGRKIKNFAKWSCWITIVLIWITSIILFFNFASHSWSDDYCWIPLVAALVLPVFIWMGSWVLYAFGEFVEDIHAIRYKDSIAAEEKVKREAEEKVKQEAEARMKQQAEERAAMSALVFYCSACDQTFVGKGCGATDKPECPNCKAETRSTGISKSVWLQMSRDDRENFKNLLKNN